MGDSCCLPSDVCRIMTKPEPAGGAVGSISYHNPPFPLLFGNLEKWGVIQLIRPTYCMGNSFHSGRADELLLSNSCNSPLTIKETSSQTDV